MLPAVRTLLLTDVVDSTRLVESLGDARAAELWVAHDRMTRDLLASHDGREIDRTDGFLLLFEDVAGAAAHAVAYHRSLAELGARLGVPLTARAGLHRGEVLLRTNAPEDVARGAKPVEVEGLAKPVAARIMSLATGGQTLLTESARSALAGALPDGWEIRSHGHHRLKGVADPVEVFELGVPGESPFLPPPDTPKAHRVVRRRGVWRPARDVPHALPAEADAFIGRKADLVALARRFDEGARLVTLAGPGGTGKTRLARRYAWTWLGEWPGGAWFCDLAEARSVEGIAAVVRSQLGVPLGRDAPEEQLARAIAGRGRCLLLLDNFEQVVEHASATVGRWVEGAPEACFLVTSRERLRLPGEEVVSLEPLPVDGDAVELFAARARAQVRDFAVTDENREAVQEVVRLVDGLPLAIELAAARVRVLSPAQLVARMKDRFALLVGARGGRDRQATLRAAIDWSWNLLEPWEQAALAQCSVFAGGFTLEAAEAVIDLSGCDGAPLALDAVQALVDKSLLRTWTEARLDIGEPYFGMYVSIREYASQKLRDPDAVAGGGSGPAAAESADTRHGTFFSRFGADEALESLLVHGGMARRKALALELENLVVACRRAIRRGDAPTAVGCYRAAWAVLELCGPFETAASLGVEVVRGLDLSPFEEARVRRTLGIALWIGGHPDRAGEELEASLAIARSAGDRHVEGLVLGSLGSLLIEKGDMEGARDLYQESLSILRDLGDRVSEGIAVGRLGALHYELGRIDEALRHYDEAIAIHAEVGNRRDESLVRSNLGVLHKTSGRIDAAREEGEAALAIARDIGDRTFEGRIVGNLGSLDREQGRREEALRQYEDALTLHREVGDRRFEGLLLDNLGLLHAESARLSEARDHYERARALHRAVEDRRSEGIGLVFAGQLALEQGRLDEAEELLETALAIHRDLGNRSWEGRTLGSLGALELERGRPATAREHGEAALAIHRELHAPLPEGEMLALLGRLDAEEGRLDEAAERYERALELHRDIGCEAGRGITLGMLGGLRTREGRLDEARAALEEGECLLRAAGDSLELAKLACRRGRLDHLAGDPDAARARLAEARATARAAGVGPDSPLARAVAALGEAVGEAAETDTGDGDADDEGARG